ncbi:MAG: preprotein translocase subunit SecG [Pseudomonadota bacterium]
MENIVLIVHLILALCLIGAVLLQRSEGGGLGMGGGGGGGGGLVSSRGAATALGKLTWLFAVAFIATSITLTIFAAQNSADSSVLDRLGSGALTPPAAEEAGDSLLPPATSSEDAAPADAPLLPPRAN